MDYSLFLVKLTLNKKEAADIFGDDSNDGNIENEEKNKIDEINDNLKINKQKGKGKIKDIRHYSQYLYPSLRAGAGYIIAIIDYFQYFNFFKVIEANVISNLITGFDKDKNKTISCVNPKYYSKRFIKYFNQLTDIAKIREFNESNGLENIEENEEENNIDNEESEEKKVKESENINVIENDQDNSDDNINVDLKEKSSDDINFNLRIKIMNKNLVKKKSFLKNQNSNVRIKKRPIDLKKNKNKK